jgi:hypothetical protein
MCLFSLKVESVSNTRIFARTVAAGRQVLAYEMTLSAREDLAMVLPLPVPPGSAEDAVCFISLAGYPRSFVDLEKGFPEPASRGGTIRLAPRPAALEVVQVGSFEASFVPTLADFDRLDARFRLAPDVWDAVPAYRDWGFAVFKLKPGAREHPMAFEFPRRDARLFFPTLHVHDGRMHPRADFDHVLYCQRGEEDLWEWRESPGPARAFVDELRDPGLVDSDRGVWRRRLFGSRRNEDIVV